MITNKLWKQNKTAFGKSLMPIFKSLSDSGSEISERTNYSINITRIVSYFGKRRSRIVVHVKEN